jgi:hypothetical protein
MALQLGVAIPSIICCNARLRMLRKINQYKNFGLVRPRSQCKGLDRNPPILLLVTTGHPRVPVGDVCFLLPWLLLVVDEAGPQARPQAIQDTLYWFASSGLPPISFPARNSFVPESPGDRHRLHSPAPFVVKRPQQAKQINPSPSTLGHMPGYHHRSLL